MTGRYPPASQRELERRRAKLYAAIVGILALAALAAWAMR